MLKKTKSHTYRADGLRHSRTMNNQREDFLWDGNQIVRITMHLAHGTFFNNLQRGPGGQLLSSSQDGYMLHNARGDVVQRVFPVGGMFAVFEYQYDAFGNPIHARDCCCNTTNRFRFGGEYFDWETGTHYLRARNYMPRVGQFTQPDPHWDTGNMIFGDNPVEMSGRMVSNRYAIMQAGNLYAFAVNNSVMWGDPSGRVIRPELFHGIFPGKSSVFLCGGSGIYCPQVERLISYKPVRPAHAKTAPQSVLISAIET